MINKKIAIENCMTEDCEKYLYFCDTNIFPTDDDEGDYHFFLYVSRTHLKSNASAVTSHGRRLGSKLIESGLLYVCEKLHVNMVYVGSWPGGML